MKMLLARNTFFWTNVFLSSQVIGIVVGEMVDRSDLTAAALSQDVLTVFQFHGYILEHEVQDMETHLLYLAREGEHKGVRDMVKQRSGFFLNKMSLLL